MKLTPVMVLIYNFAILAGTAYLVQAYNWSPWWFLLTALCFTSYKSDD